MQFVGPASLFLEPPVVIVRPVSVFLPGFLHHSMRRSQFLRPASPFLGPRVDFVWPVFVFFPEFLHHSRSCWHFVRSASLFPFLGSRPVWLVSVLLPIFLDRWTGLLWFVGPASSFGFDLRSRWQFVGPVSPFLDPVAFVWPASRPLFSAYVVSILQTAQNVFTFCFSLRISASLDEKLSS